MIKHVCVTCEHCNWALLVGARVSCTDSEFRAAVTSNGYPVPSSNVYDAFNSYVDDGEFSSKRELAMFLAEIIWESGGLRYKSEMNPPAGAYRNLDLVAASHL